MEEALEDSLKSWRPENKRGGFQLFIHYEFAHHRRCGLHRLQSHPPGYRRSSKSTKLVNLDCLTYAGRLENLEQVSHHPKYVLEQVDLRDKAATLQVVEQHAITQVMHLAAESHVDRSISRSGRFHHHQHCGDVQSAGSLPRFLEWAI